MVRAAIPAIKRTATTSMAIVGVCGALYTCGSIVTLPWGDKGSQLLGFVDKWAVRGCGSTVFMVRATIPAIKRTATTSMAIVRVCGALYTCGSIVTLPWGGKGSQLLPYVDKWAVRGYGSAVFMVRAAIPAIKRTATTSMAIIRVWGALYTSGPVIALPWRGKGSQLLGYFDNWAVSRCGSAVHAVRTAIPVYFLATPAVTITFLFV